MFGSIHSRRERATTGFYQSTLRSIYNCYEYHQGGGIADEQSNTQPTDAEIAAYMRMVARRKEAA